MKVLMTADTVGGVWTYALELARALARHGVQVVLATQGAPPSAEQRRQAASLPSVELHASGYRLEWMPDAEDDVLRAGDWLLDLEARTQPDVIHLNGYAHGALPWRAPVVVVGHSCVLSWWQAVKGEPAPPAWHAYAAAVRRGLHAARLVVAPSRAMLAALDHHYGPLPNTAVIPNARSAAHFPPREKAPLIFAAGRVWDEAKNVAALEAVARWLPWPVYVAGHERSDGRAAAPNGAHAPKAAGGSAYRLGHLPAGELAHWLGCAAIYALPARYEPFGLSVLEAALAGCALVLGDIASLRENWDGAALFVPPHDPAALRGALARLMASRRLRTGLARAARQRALAFTPERMAAGYLAAYARVRGLTVAPRLAPAALPALSLPPH